MRKLLAVPAFYVLLTSCHFTIYEDGRFVTHKLTKPSTDSILVVALSNNFTMPASAAKVGDIEIKAPFQKVNEYAQMVAYAKNESHKLGGM